VNRAFLALAAATLAACAIPYPDPDRRMDDARSLAAAESAFAADSLREDMRAAFMAHFAADGMMPRGGWVNAREFLAPRAAPPIVLDWRPVFTEVAASGEMGLSTGPSRITSKADPSQPPGYGQFVSIWKRAGAGPWQVAVDLGIRHPGPVFWDKPLETVAVRVDPAPAGDTIEAAERRFAADTLSMGALAAYERHGSASMRLYRDNAAPRVGKAAALSHAGLAGEPRAWIVEKSETARSRDFGYARGAFAATPGGAVAGWYLRAWHREAGAWRIAMDVTQPAPPPRPAQ
jgi:ketosteroid isomerase-like protein